MEREIKWSESRRENGGGQGEMETRQIGDEPKAERCCGSCVRHRREG